MVFICSCKKCLGRLLQCLLILQHDPKTSPVTLRLEVAYDLNMHKCVLSCCVVNNIVNKFARTHNLNRCAVWRTNAQYRTIQPRHGTPPDTTRFIYL